MTFKRKKKGIAALLAVLVVALAAIGAYAYWTTSGDGTGSADTGTSVDFVVTQVGTAPTGLVPGGAAQGVAINVQNTASFNQYMTALAFEVDPAWSEQADGGKPACDADDFTLVQPTVAAVDLAPGNHTGATYTGTIALKNTASNQDNCKNVTVDLLLHAS